VTSPAQLRKEATLQMQKTKHVKRGRVWDNVPHERAAGADPYAINRISLRVARGDSVGRWEAFERSRQLMVRLDRIGKDALCVVGMSVAGAPLPYTAARSLSLYLRASHGLTYFRRTHPLGSTASVLCDLLSRIGIPTHNVIRSKPTNQVSAGSQNPCRSGADSQRSQPGR
jgi:hypothetical protein